MIAKDTMGEMVGAKHSHIKNPNETAPLEHAGTWRMSINIEQEFDKWWAETGSGIVPRYEEGKDAYAKRVAHLAWINGADTMLDWCKTVVVEPLKHEICE